jgi:hypothetical protein
MSLKTLTEQRHLSTRTEELEKPGVSTETGGTHSFVALWANLSGQSEMEGFVDLAEIASFVPSLCSVFFFFR